MFKIFESFDIDPDSVSFRYTASRVKEHVFIDKPDGIGVTQWLEFWENVKELYEDGRSLQDILDETESDELAELRKSNDELERDNDRLEKRNDDLIYEIAELKARIAELEK